LLLAGGRSHRFGRDKRVVRLNGEALWTITLGKLRRVAGGRVMIAGGGGLALYRHGSRVEKVPDAVIGGGPLAALVAGLQRSSNGLVVLACDLPFLTTSFLAYMLSVPATADVVLPRDQHGLQPLCAVYARSCLPELDRRLAQSSLSLVDFVRSVDYRSLEAADYAQFDPEGVLMTNLNTTQDYDRAQAMVQGMA